MDAVYKLYNNHASSKVNIKQYFDDYIKAIKSNECNLPVTKDDKNIFDVMGVTLENEEATLLTEYCSIDNLTVSGEASKVNNKHTRRKDVFKPTEISDDIDLETIKSLKKRLNEPSSSINLKYQSELFINYEKTEPHGDLAIPGRDILVYFRIYEPFIHNKRQTADNQTASKVLLNTVVAALGFQTLSQLRDKITCVSDLSISLEVSNNLGNAVAPMAKDVYKSGFFYIEDTFYNDNRDPSNISYSDVIINWAKTRELGPFRTASMESARIDSLSARFGFPWVYQHQGSCEHLIILSDARLITCDDELSVSEYPRITKIRPRGSKYCMMCGVLSVRWITTENDRVPHNPCYFCDSCFKSYNYIDSRKVGNFKAYAYPCNPELIQSEQEMDE